MPLDSVGRRYADKLYQQSLEQILETQTAELTEVTNDFNARNIIRSGLYLTALAKVYIRNAELIAQARVDALLHAYERSGIPVSNMVLQEINSEVTPFCDQQGRNIIQALQNRIGQTFGGQSPAGLREALAGQVLRRISGVSARISRKLSIGGVRRCSQNAPPLQMMLQPKLQPR